MFESDLLDKLSRVHPVVPLIVFIPAIAVLFALGQEGNPPLEVIAWIAGGWVFWGLAEYWLHRLVFHFEPEGGIGARLHWIIHGVHHDHPNDPMRLVMPPSASIPLALIFAALFYVLLGESSFLAFTAGFLGGYLAYDMVHYAVHHHTPKSRVGKKLRELHMRHHFQDDERGFGISAPYWDKVFRTNVRKRSSTTT